MCYGSGSRCMFRMPEFASPTLGDFVGILKYFVIVVTYGDGYATSHASIAKKKTKEVRFNLALVAAKGSPHLRGRAYKESS